LYHDAGGRGVRSEKGFEATTGTLRFEVDPRYFRPTEVDLLLGEPSKAGKKLGWKHNANFEDIMREMVDLILTV
jgi:GDPmannose 4,6-dehydratase